MADSKDNKRTDEQWSATSKQRDPDTAAKASPEKRIGNDDGVMSTESSPEKKNKVKTTQFIDITIIYYSTINKRIKL